MTAPEIWTRSRASTGIGWWILAAVIAGADQAMKHVVHSGLRYGDAIPITGFFSIVHQRNPGAAFSFLADAGGWQRYFFTAIALVVSVVLGWMLAKPLRPIEAVSHSLILGGALGNVIDRINRGYVVDFLDFYWQGWHWPAFNFADIGICVGAALLIAVAFRASSGH